MKRSQPMHQPIEAGALLREALPSVLIRVVPSELREAFEGDLHERLGQDVLLERGILGARRWLRRELVRSLPRMLWRRAISGAHPARRGTLAALLIGLASWEAVLIGAHEGPVALALRSASILAFSLAVVLRARTFANRLWLLDYFVVTVVALLESSGMPLVLSHGLMTAISAAMQLRVPWNFWSWRFLTTWEGGSDTPRRPRAS